MVYFVDTLIFSTETTTGDGYYIGQPLIVTCRKSVLKADGLVLFGVRVGVDMPVIILCTRSTASGVWSDSVSAMYLMVLHTYQIVMYQTTITLLL